MKWLWYVLAVLLIGWAVWDHYAERKKILASAARARQAKADKKLFSELKLNDDEPIRDTSQEVDPSRDEHEAEKTA